MSLVLSVLCLTPVSAVVSECPGSIGDFIWHDLDRDGIQDAGEPGIDGITVRLIEDSSGRVLSTVMTGVGPLGQHGYYRFDGVCDGRYRVEVSGVPLGFVGAQPCSTDESVPGDSNCTPAQMVSLPVPGSAENRVNMTIDFGFVGPCKGTLGDYVWHDLNRNGIQDSGEHGIEGVRVILRDAAGNPLASTTTGPAGFYQFTGLCAGTYQVVLENGTVPVGFVPTSPCSSSENVGNDSNSDDISNCTPLQTVTFPSDNTRNPTIDFGFVSRCTGSIGDFIWYDLNRNGLQEPGEPGIEGVRVILRDAAGAQIAVTTTGPLGAYRFTGLCAGTYQVEVDTGTVPPNYVPTFPCSDDQDLPNDSNSDDTASCTPYQTVTLISNDAVNPTIDFGFVSPCTGSIGDFVWQDLNRNGFQDNGEPGIQGVRVILRDAQNTMLAVTTTNADGYYEFTGLCAGAYRVEVEPNTVPDGLVPTTPCSSSQSTGNDSNANGAPDDCSPVQDVLLSTDTTENPTIDFGFESPCRGVVGDFVWHDLKRDGIQGEGEPGINGVRVILRDAAGEAIAETTTAGNGSYRFSGLCEGDYTVEVDETTLSAGFTPTPVCSSDQDVSDDSNANGAPGDCSPVQDVGLSSDIAQNLTIDFGFVSECDLAVNKTCLVVTPPGRPFDCGDAKPIDSLAMIWNGSQPIRIRAWKGSVGSTLLADIDNIAVGQEVTVTGFAGSPNDVCWEIFVAGTGNKLGESTFHLSCSDDDMDGPEDCGKFEGDGKDKAGYINTWIFEGMGGNGLVLDCNPDPVAGEDTCSFVLQPPPNCETVGSKPQSLTFLYTGSSCLASDNDQDSGKWHCIDMSLGDTVPVAVIKDVNKVRLNADTVSLGGLLTVSAIGSDMGSELILLVGGQEVKLHTSCSQPLAAGDVFGSLELVRFNGLGEGSEILYTYAITNNGEFSALLESVYDDRLGELLELPVELGVGETETIETSAFVDRTTTNTVNVFGTSQGGQCSARDAVTVTVLQQPPCEVASVEFKINDDKIEWKLYNASDKLITVSEIGISWPAQLGALKKIKREGDTMWEGLAAPPSASFDSADFVSNPDKRQIKPDDEDKLVFEFVNKAVTAPGDYSVDVGFEEGCSISFDPLLIPFVCSDAKPIDSLTMIWNGMQPVWIRAWKGSVGGTLLAESDSLMPGATVTVGGMNGSPNDQYWEVFDAATGVKVGESVFHISCSDSAMNGPEDCGTPQGNGKDDRDGYLDSWLFEGMAGRLTLDCSP